MLKIHRSLLAKRVLFWMIIGLFTLGIVIGVLFITYAILLVIFSYIEIKKEKIIYKEGVFKKKSKELDINNINGKIKITRGPLQSILGLCSFEIKDKNNQTFITFTDFPFKKVELLAKICTKLKENTD